jgi:hypothetical protein
MEFKVHEVLIVAMRDRLSAWTGLGKLLPE